MKLPQQLVTCSIFAFPLAQNGRLWAFQVQNAVKSGTRSETDSSVAALVAQLQATERFKDRLQVLSAWGTAKVGHMCLQRQQLRKRHCGLLEYVCMGGLGQLDWTPVVCLSCLNLVVLWNYCNVADMSDAHFLSSD